MVSTRGKYSCKNLRTVGTDEHVMRFFNNISNAILSHHILLRHYHVIQVHVQSPLTTDSLAYHNFDVFCSTISSDVEKKSVVVGVS